QYWGTTLPTAMVASEMKKFADKHPDLKKYRSAKAKTINIKMIDDGRSDFKNNFKNVISSLATSAVVKVEVQKLVDYHFKIAFESKKTSYSDYYNYIVAFESSVQNNPSIIS